MKIVKNWKSWKNIRTRFFLLAVLLASLLAACGIGQKARSAESSKPTVLLITDSSGENDESFNQAAFKGILEFYGETWNNQTSRGILYNTRRCPTEADYTSSIVGASEEKKWDVIVVTGFSFADALTEVAPRYPNQKFMIVDADWINQPNVAQYMFAEHEGSFLAGAAVALKAVESGLEEPVFGFIGGVPSSTITKFEVGYIQGIYSILPHAEIVDFYADSWDAADIAYAHSKAWYDSGVFAIFSAAGGTGMGSIECAREYRRQGSDVWAVGVDSDQYDSGLYAPSTSAVLTSMIKKVETATFNTLTSIQNNSFQGNITVTLSLEQDGVGFASTNTLLSADIVSRLNGLRNDIINKRIAVIPTYRDSLNAGIVPAGLGAKD